MELNWIVLDPSASQIQISRVPLRSDVKTTRLPSGENEGLESESVDAAKRAGTPTATPDGESSVRQIFTSVDLSEYANCPRREATGSFACPSDNASR